MKKNVTVLGGLHTDNTPVDQPKGTTRFALNTVDETNQGESGRRSNEESNEECYQLKPGYTPLGQVYIGNNENLIASVSPDEVHSELGIVDRECNYTPVVEQANLGFKIGHQIDMTFRLRMGCERTVYWADPVPRTMNIDSPEDYKTFGHWDERKFKLFKRHELVPTFSEITEEESGNIDPGGYFFAVQYLDQDFNPTEFITSSGRVNIYNDSVSRSFNDVRGSTGMEDEYHKYGKTNKAVKIRLSNLDPNYPFFRLAIVKYTSGNGELTSVEYSPEIPTEVGIYTYTGNGVSQGTLAEIQAIPMVIDKAEHIEQLQNKLLLHNVKGKQIDYCNLQKYASRIKANVVFKKVVLNEISNSNPKKPTAPIDGLGHMPGEIESFGVVYVFDDGTTSPTYHIPGKNPEYPSKMSNDNVCQDTFYTDNTSCDDYWGVDSEGIPLKNQPVRHHRFPLRSEVSKPLVVKDSFTKTVIRNTLTLLISGTLDETDKDFVSFTVKYVAAGIEEIYYGNLNVATYDPEVGITRDIDSSLDEISIVSVEEDFPSGLEYQTEIREQEYAIEDGLYTTEIMGVEFSGVDLPSTNDTNGNKVVGYYIVKNERTEENKTILDSGVVTPTMEEPYYVAGGAHISPKLSDPGIIKKDLFGIIHPEHRFTGQEHKNTTEILQEGEFYINKQVISSARTQDVMAGTSYDPDVAKGSESDNDGFSLHTLTKDSGVSFRMKPGDFLNSNDLEEVFYLDALSSKPLTDMHGERKEAFNVSSDNKMGFIRAGIEKEISVGTLPYVVMRRNISNPYSNFRYLPYYKASNNIVKFIDGESSKTTVFAGDAYVSPVRYSNTFFYDTRIRERDTKSGWWMIVAGALAVIGAALLTIFTLGAGAPLLTPAIGLMVAGLGAAAIASGLKTEKIASVYRDAYQAGLKDCIEDENTNKYFEKNPPDDEVQWIGETVTTLWFETTINTALRHGMTNGLPDFLNAPMPMADKPESDATHDEPQNELDSYFLEKLTVLDSENSNGRLYQGFANAEIYRINPDFAVIDKSKIFHHLGIEYDCCSDCNKIFRGRTHWSETSFQEELIDNYRIFLPNNYRDIEGETGEITNTFRIQNALFIHTKEALWHLPENFQERVTGEILSFLGTGEFFNIPPRKILDGNESSAGTRHKWGMIKTKYGVLFPSIDDKKWYLFDGKELQPISDIGNSKWFLRNMEFTAEKQYYASNKRNFPYSNNPVSKHGVGFISTYDTSKERFILTKKDYVLKPEYAANQDYEICQSNNSLTIFNNYKQTINSYVNNGYEFEGVEDCKMKFSKQYFKTVRESREVAKTIPNTADLHFMYDTSGSFGAYDGPDLTSIKNAVAAWLADFRAANPDWTGDVYEYPDRTERWLAYPEKIAAETYLGQDLSKKDIIVVSFCNESTPYGNGSGLQSAIPNPTTAYTDDYDSFLNIHSIYRSFTGIHYPIVFESGTYSNQGKALVQQSIAAIYAGLQVPSIGPRNEAFTEAEWNTMIDSFDMNPYNTGLDSGLTNYGWVGRWNRNNIGSIINPVDFAEDINGLLAGKQSTEIIEVDVQVPVTVFDYVDGEPISEDEFILADNSWTFSYSLKRKEWISWHSFIPSFYMYTSGKFYSWKNGSDHLWRHNRQGHYQTFYGQYYPHILEEVSVSNQVQARTFEDIGFQTEVQRFFETEQEYNIVNDVTFNKLLAYNSRQITGELLLRDKNNGAVNYLMEQVDYVPGEITLDNNEGTWQVNAIRDIRIDANVPMFKSDLISRQNAYFIDKVINTDAISFNKPWFEQESLRDKYLVIRFIFDTFDNVKLITKYSLENEDLSNR